MNRFFLMTVLVFSSIVLFYISCKKEEKEEDDDIDPRLKIVEGFSFDNYPKVDGSTSTAPLNTLIACKLLGIKHQWMQKSGLWEIEPILKLKKNSENFQRLIKTSQTHQSFINLIKKEADIILSARKMSPDERTYADDAGVSLIETPIALDAFIFIIHPNNPIESLSIEQIQDIYVGKITNWKEIGGNDITINPYIRNANSGSQELMESLVMKGLGFMEFPQSPEIPIIPTTIFDMIVVIDRVSQEINSICYTVFYYKEEILRNLYITKSIAIESVYPDKESISNNSYPLVAEVYAVIRSDLDKSSMAYKLFELLQTETGKEVISESGYLPN